MEHPDSTDTKTITSVSDNHKYLKENFKQIIRNVDTNYQKYADAKTFDDETIIKDDFLRGWTDGINEVQKITDLTINRSRKTVPEYLFQYVETDVFQYNGQDWYLNLSKLNWLRTYTNDDDNDLLPFNCNSFLILLPSIDYSKVMHYYLNLGDTGLMYYLYKVRSIELLNESDDDDNLQRSQYKHQHLYSIFDYLDSHQELLDAENNLTDLLNIDNGQDLIFDFKCLIRRHYCNYYQHISKYESASAPDVLRESSEFSEFCSSSNKDLSYKEQRSYYIGYISTIHYANSIIEDLNMSDFTKGYKENSLFKMVPINHVKRVTPLVTYLGKKRYEPCMKFHYYEVKFDGYISNISVYEHSCDFDDRIRCYGKYGIYDDIGSNTSKHVENYFKTNEEYAKFMNFIKIHQEFFDLINQLSITKLRFISNKNLNQDTDEENL